MTTKLLVATGVAALAVAAAGCGGSDNASDTTTTEATPAAEWADGFCTAISTWKTDVTSVKDEFTDLSSFSEDSLKSATDDIQTATDQLVENLKSIGAPDTESGQEVKDSIDELASTLDTQLADIQTSVDDASGLTALPGAIQDVLSSLSAMSTAFSSTLSTIGDADVQGELKDALEASPACDDLTS